MTRDFFWPKADLPAGEVHAGWCALAAPDDLAAQLAACLSPAEHARAGRFRRAADRHSYQVSRGLLRRILAGYLDAAPELIRLEQGPRGKPCLAGAPGPDSLRFSLAHAGGLGLFAFARGLEVGADLELVRPLPNLAGLAARVFSPRERADLEALPAPARLRAFFDGWTRKEAFVKACGDGLYRPLDSFEVSLLPGEPARLWSVDGEAQAAARWTLHALEVAPEVSAALAVEGQVIRLRTWPWFWRPA